MEAVNFIDTITYSRLFKTLRAYLDSFEELKKERNAFIYSTYETNRELLTSQLLSDAIIWEDNEVYGEVLESRYAVLISEIKTIDVFDKKLEYLAQKINRILKFISALKTKFLQLQKLNRRKLYRSKVNLIFKNLDDSHLGFELFSLKNNSINNLKFKYYPLWNQHMNSLPSC